MDNYRLYKEIKMLIYKYDLFFRSSRDYEEFIIELSEILDI